MTGKDEADKGQVSPPIEEQIGTIEMEHPFKKIIPELLTTVMKDFPTFESIAKRIEEVGMAHKAFENYKKKIEEDLDGFGREEKVEWREAGFVQNFEQLAVNVSPHLGVVAEALFQKTGKPRLAASYRRGAGAFGPPNKAFP
jgi:hypothetical protein